MSQINCSAALSIEHLSIDSQETDYIILGFGNGKLLQLTMDVAQARGIIEDPLENPPFLSYTKFMKARLNMEEDMQDDSGVTDDAIGPIWGAQVCYVGTIHPKMTRLETEQGTAIIACCDRPVVFYEANESLEMHYLAFKEIR